MVTKPAIVILQASAHDLAGTIAAAVDGQVHGPESAGAAKTYTKFADHLRALFAGGIPIIGICATGILVRILSSELGDKTAEPAVIAVSEDGASIVPVLGGHNGANRLAAQIAEATSGHAAITTASDTAFGIALDDPPDGYVLANREHIKPFVTALLAGAAVEMNGEAAWLADAFPPAPRGEEPEVEKLTITTTTSRIAGGPDHLVYHPKTLTLGIGCERGAEAAGLIAHVEDTLKRAEIAPASIAMVASIDLKSDETAIHALARRLDVPARFFTADQLNAEAARLAKPSDIVMAEVGCPGVAEGAALASAGADAGLLVEKSVANRTTCAIARRPDPITELAGTPQGRLFVIGIGPGTPDWRSPAATLALQTATDWVGYGLYLDLVEDLLTGQTEHRFPLGGEEDRVRHAINQAAMGKDVALICSGDAGIYAMAALVYEVLDLEPQRIAVDVIPGISAFQAAAARAGALIGHDFCCISLSDLLTPWEVIETRLKAAAEGDFVTAFYNPRSLKRTTQLARAIEVLSPYRTPHTPVVIASSLGRPDEAVRIVPLKDFNPQDVDMLTLVMVGASQSQTVTRGDGQTYAYTPRGYAKKRQDLAS
ncbi:MAG: precorrin-3B C(17)-methyltransferase [Rhizobiales bacterium]|nr:precorrin-3B C(17)-methyltransferase [Hyphomicrobiales bacterium]